MSEKDSLAILFFLIGMGFALLMRHLLCEIWEGRRWFLQWMLGSRRVLAIVAAMERAVKPLREVAP